MSGSQTMSVSWKRRVWAGLFFVFLLFAGWVGWINRPRQPYEVSVLPPTLLNLIDTTPTSTSFENGGEADQEKEDSANNIKGENQVQFQCELVYSPGYLIDLGGLEKMHPFDIRKYQKIYDKLIEVGTITGDQVFRPSLLETADLRLVHTQEYLENLKQRTNVAKYLEAPPLLLAPVSLKTAVLEPFLRASGGTLLAARLALDSGIGINIGGGYHHAKPECGEGFCLYADVPIAIRKLQKEGRIKQALVVDVDAHQGNGTILCLENDESTFTFSIHQGNIYPIPKEKGDRDVLAPEGCDDDRYLNILNEHLEEVIAESNPDICFIVGGCDTLGTDPLASMNMTVEGILRRDEAIVSACVERKIPVVLTLAGGYSPNAWEAQYRSIRNLLEKFGLRKRKQEKK
ncbi:MAG: histone deacetylase [Planctomycetota bacterium]